MNPLGAAVQYIASILEGRKLLGQLDPLSKAVNAIADAAGLHGVDQQGGYLSYDPHSDAPSEAFAACVDALERLTPALKTARLKQAAAALQAQKTPPPQNPGAGDGDALVTSIIQLRDQLAYMRTEAQGDAATLLVSLYKQTGKLLDQNGIHPIEDAGTLDPTRHMVSSTLPTADDALHQTIAETVRPGYLRGGDLIRPQEVVVYVKGGV